MSVTIEERKVYREFLDPGYTLASLSEGLMAPRCLLDRSKYLKTKGVFTLQDQNGLGD